MKALSKDDLGFSFSVSKKGDLVIYRQGRVATRFSRTRGVDIANQLEMSSFPEQQQIMARLTGNYKHGDERQSSNGFV